MTFDLLVVSDGLTVLLTAGSPPAFCRDTNAESKDLHERENQMVHFDLRQKTFQPVGGAVEDSDRRLGLVLVAAAVLPPRLNTLDCFMSTEATRNYERGVMTLGNRRRGHAGGGAAGVGGAFSLPKDSQDDKRVMKSVIKRQLKKSFWA